MSSLRRTALIASVFSTLTSLLFFLTGVMSLPVPLPTAKALKSVTVDTGIFVDASPGDNTWTAQPDGRR